MAKCSRSASENSTLSNVTDYGENWKHYSKGERIEEETHSHVTDFSGGHWYPHWHWQKTLKHQPIEEENQSKLAQSNESIDLDSNIPLKRLDSNKSTSSSDGSIDNFDFSGRHWYPHWHWQKTLKCQPIEEDNQSKMAQSNELMDLDRNRALKRQDSNKSCSSSDGSLANFEKFRRMFPNPIVNEIPHCSRENSKSSMMTDIDDWFLPVHNQLAEEDSDSSFYGLRRQYPNLSINEKPNSSREIQPSTSSCSKDLSEIEREVDWLKSTLQSTLPPEYLSTNYLITAMEDHMQHVNEQIDKFMNEVYAYEESVKLPNYEPTCDEYIWFKI